MHSAVLRGDQEMVKMLLAHGADVNPRLANGTYLKRGSREFAFDKFLVGATPFALARLGNHPRSRALLQRAIEVAETAGDMEGAGRAHLSIIEEMGEQTSATELVSIYQSAATRQAVKLPLAADPPVIAARWE